MDETTRRTTPRTSTPVAVRPLSRMCDLTEFDACRSVADWQQQIVCESYRRWTAETPIVEGLILCINLSGTVVVLPDSTVYRPVATPRLRQHERPAALLACTVLDRLPSSPVTWIKQWAEQLLPGGLFVNTVACWDAMGEDRAIGAEVRTRIYDVATLRKLDLTVRECGLRPFGGVDRRYKGNTLGDHTLAAICWRKETGPGLGVPAEGETA